MKKGKFRRECGSVEVEATIILPIAILSVILLLYLSLFMFQRANLQACLETTLIYYKNTATDTYVTQNEELEYVVTNESSMAGGNSYSATAPLFPYRGGIFDVIDDAVGGGGENDFESEEAFRKYFKSVAGNMLFDNNLDLNIDYTNYMLYKQLKVTAIQRVEAPISFDMLGVDNEFEIFATAMVNVIDHDSMIRDVDYAIDIVENTKLGDIARNFAAEFGELYQKMKDALGVEDE